MDVVIVYTVDVVVKVQIAWSTNITAAPCDYQLLLICLKTEKAHESNFCFIQ